MLRVAWHACYAHPLPEGHRFPMAKYEILPEQLLYEGTLEHAHFFEPGLLDEALLLKVHEAEYWQKLKTGQLSKHEERRTGFPYSMALVERERRIMQGTVECVDHALRHGVAMNIAGGTHHAYAGHGEGFCLLNDLALGAHYALANGLAQRVLIIDLDVHQGNGTASLFADDPRVFTFSMHGAKNYPMKKEQSDLDEALPDGCDDSSYLSRLRALLPDVFERFQPDFAFFQTGVDVLEEDKLGRLALSVYGCKQRDQVVFDLCKQNKVPVVCAMGGGYAPNLRTIVEAHANTFRLAQEIYF